MLARLLLPPALRLLMLMTLRADASNSP